MSELSWEDQQQIQEQLRQQKEQEKDYPINNSTIPLVGKPKSDKQVSRNLRGRNRRRLTDDGGRTFSPSLPGYLGFL